MWLWNPKNHECENTEPSLPQLQHLTILIVNSCSILNAPPSLQVLSGARENALAQFESILQSSCISKNSSFRLKHTGVPNGSDGSGGTLYPLTENQTRRVALHTSPAAAIIPCLLFLQRVALYIRLAAPASGFLYFASGMW